MSNGSPDDRRRTVLLSAVVVLGVIVLALVGFLVFRDSSAPLPGSDSAPTAPATSSTTETSPTSTSRTSAEPRPQPTATSVAPGSVTYQLTGDGDVVALAYRNSSGRVLVAATGTPWTQRTTVADRDVELTAVVIRGPVTCTILQGDELVSSSTSHGGPLRCAGRLPR